ncbi:MAG: AAA family ATPase, partial [Candidatus Berkiellales bacterium]
QALLNPTLYPHPVSGFQLIETHLSWVILTGQYAYKIKKPLNLGFQDFTTLEKRKKYCELEVRLNQRFAPQIYVDVVPITGNPQNPSFDRNQTIIEYAVKMKEFPQSNLLSILATQRKITKEIIKALAMEIAHFHRSTETADPASSFGTPQSVYAPMQANFTALKSLPDINHHIELIQHIEQWTRSEFEKLTPLLQSRKKNGFIRACHGDLHLGNIVMIDNQPIPFDCIEFNEEFRWTDVYNDVGFLAMDLHHQRYSELSHLFINQYLEASQDYEGIALLPFYECYRAMVRAKVMGLQINQLPRDPALRSKYQEELRDFLTLTQQFIQPKAPQLTITFGLSGSGKTVYTEQLLMQSGALRLRSDVIRKKLFGHEPKAALYSIETTQQLFSHLVNTATILLNAQRAVIIDATFIKRWQRQHFLELAKAFSIPLKILAFDVPLNELQQRIRQRLQQGKDASDADLAVLTSQLQEIEPLTAEEQALANVI